MNTPKIADYTSRKGDAGNHGCEYDSESEDSRCPHCGLTSGEAIKFLESNQSPVHATAKAGIGKGRSHAFYEAVTAPEL